MSLAILEKKSIRQSVMPVPLSMYHKMASAGFLNENTELLEGVIITKMTKSPLHSMTVQLMVKFLESVIVDGFHVRKEEPLSIEKSQSEPEPDIAIVRGVISDYSDAHPVCANWIIEVALQSINRDRDKSSVYATIAPVYWIINPQSREVEIFENPQHGSYQNKRVLSYIEKIDLPLIDNVLQKKSICLEKIL